MVTRTPDVSGGHLQPNDVLSGREQLAGLRQVLASSTNGWPGWQAKLQFPGESAAARYSARVKAVCQELATVWLVVSVLQEFSNTALAAVFPIAEAYRASISIPAACFHETWWEEINYFWSLSSQLSKCTDFSHEVQKLLGRQVNPDIPTV